MLSVPPKPVENPGKVCENSRAGENPRLRLGFSRIFSGSNSPKHLPLFSPGYEGTENMFYLLNKHGGLFYIYTSPVKRFLCLVYRSSKKYLHRVIFYSYMYRPQLNITYLS